MMSASIPILKLRDEVMAIRHVKMRYRSNLSCKEYEVEYVVIRELSPKCPLCGERARLIGGGAYFYPVYYCDRCKALIEMATPGSLADFDKGLCMFCRTKLNEDLTCPRCGAVHVVPHESKWL